MNISTDKEIYELCSLIDSTCGNLEGTKLLLEYWNKHGKLVYFNRFCNSSTNWSPSSNEIQYLVRVETILDKFVDRFDKFIKSTKNLPEASTIPPDKFPYVTELIGELDNLKNLRFTGQLGTFYDILEKKVSNIFMVLEKIEQFVAQSKTTLFRTNFTSGEDFLSRSSSYLKSSGTYFTKI